MKIERLVTMNANAQTEEWDRESVMQRVLEHPFFFGMTLEQLAVVAKSVEPGAAQVAAFARNEIVLHEGEPANRFYLIESGSMMLEAHEPANGTFPILKLAAGETLGFSWLFPPFTWCFQARALETSTAIVLNGAHLLLAAEENKAFGYELMKKVGQLAIRRLQATRRQLIGQGLALQKALPTVRGKP